LSGSIRPTVTIVFVPGSGVTVVDGSTPSGGVDLHARVLLAQKDQLGFERLALGPIGTPTFAAPSV